MLTARSINTTWTPLPMGGPSSAHSFKENVPSDYNATKAAGSQLTDENENPTNVVSFATPMGHPRIPLPFDAVRESPASPLRPQHHNASSSTSAGQHTQKTGAEVKGPTLPPTQAAQAARPSLKPKGQGAQRPRKCRERKAVVSQAERDAKNAAKRAYRRALGQSPEWTCPMCGTYFSKGGNQSKNHTGKKRCLAALKRARAAGDRGQPNNQQAVPQRVISRPGFSRRSSAPL